MRPSDVLRSAARYAAQDLRADLAAGLALAAVALPSQMATAHLAGFSPPVGFVAFAAAMIGFAIIGANYLVVACADSTIAPIFAGGLAALAAVGSQEYPALCASFALLTGTILLCCGLFRLGWIADLVSKPVTIGFLAGIACHIVVSQLPSLLGIDSPDGSLLQRAYAIAGKLSEMNRVSFFLGLAVFAVTVCAEWINPRIPGSLLGIAAATAAVYGFGLERNGVSVLGQIPGQFPHFQIPLVPFEHLVQAAPLAFVVVATIMVQTAATTREFPAPSQNGSLIDLDFAGVGAANLLAGYFGAFPVNASPPLTGIVAETGGRSKGAGLAAVVLILCIARFGTGLLAHVPQAALAGILFFVAMRIVRAGEIIAIFRRAFGEFLLILATLTAIVVLPVGTGVAAGIVLSLLHGIWSMTRASLIIFERVPGTSIWWPPSRDLKGEKLEGILVIAFQAPLAFLNAYKFQDQARRVLRHSQPELIVLEASSIVEIDFTAAQVILEFIEHCKQMNITFAIARLESTRAQDAFDRFGVTDAVQRDHFFHSVAEAIEILAKNPKKSNEFHEEPV
ncbi:SulP family inorganic anion transporter [Methylocapsa sp. D3K7]|uniref:SulP family inorganic anion transporter n=1 Tax=Methylocapsa sp. D3K7 TaxID=3041435 RepID=UPI00244EEF5D|nr:SulP family inorganic anion transporter [Methylocapsa sp. D3K7]WGJ14219.1 SulP family inorganic anion transporter [Methylocapsa sp. D3K7]